MSPSFQPFIDFHSWVDKNQVDGTDGLGNNAKYIPLGALNHYWQDDRISPILNASSHDAPINVSIDDLLKRYYRIFSILAYISTTQSSKLNYIKGFMEQDMDDSLLPFKVKPDALPNSVDGIQTFRDFQENQWHFSPVVLGPNRLQSKELLPRSVLPFTVEEILSGRIGESTTVKKCKVHPSCGLSVGTIVLKEFDSSEIDFSFRNEVESYIILANKVPKDIYDQQFLKFYGSFRKADKAFIMLEYTDQGSLLDFFNRNQLPLERHELYSLWRSLSNLFFGLEHIHGLEQDHRNTDSGTIRCVHQDLKPANIFVFREVDSTEYRYHFKIGDFGMSSISLVRAMSKSIRSPDNASTKMYGAPELTNLYPDLADIDYGTLWEMDIWSMGCVLFEVLVWMTCGSRGVSAFFQMRQKETDSDPRHTSQGYSGCFHNGKARIQAVDNMMDLILQRRRIFDDLSGPIGDLLLKEMLIPSNKRRLEAGTLLPRFEEILEAEKRPPGQVETFETQALRTIRGGSTPQSGMAKEDRGDEGFQQNDQARLSTAQGIRGYKPQRLESTGSHASRSVIGSRHGRCGANESRSSSEARRTREGSTSATSMVPSDGEQARESRSVTDDPKVILHLPTNIRPVSNSPLDGPEFKPDHMSTHDSRLAGESLSSNYRSPGGNISYGSLDMASGSNVKGPKPYARVTISQVLQWIDKKKKGWAPEPLPDHERAMREIDGREQIFVVDDSNTMRNHHWTEVVEAVQALGYLVKHADPDGVELFYTSRPTKPKKSGGKEITSLVRSLEEHGRKRPEGPCNMEYSLGPILDRVKSGLKKGSMFRQQTNRRGINVYILTDGIWQGGTDVRCGVEEPIKNLSRTMQESGKNRTTVALQFIQLGNDVLGEERLRYLDDTLGNELDFDIVDHRHSQRDGVWHMLVGSISRDLDKDNNAGGQTLIT